MCVFDFIWGTPRFCCFPYYAGLTVNGDAVHNIMGKLATFNAPPQDLKFASIVGGTCAAIHIWNPNFLSPFKLNVSTQYDDMGWTDQAWNSAILEAYFVEGVSKPVASYPTDVKLGEIFVNLPRGQPGSFYEDVRLQGQVLQPPQTNTV